MNKKFEYQCSRCGEFHKGSPSFGYANPPHYYDVPEGERDRRCDHSADLLVIRWDNTTDYFIRGVLEVPIIGVDEPFTWGIWTTASEENFKKYTNGFRDPEFRLVFFGWFSCRLPVYPDTMNLKCNVNANGGGQRPIVKIQESNHPLFADQENGISWDRAIEIAEVMMHPNQAK